MAAIGFFSPSRTFFRYSLRKMPSSFPPERLLFFSVCCSNETASETIAIEDGSPPPVIEIPVGTPKRTSSLISIINVQKALRGIEITNVDHYGRLGIARGESYDKVDIAYEKLCEVVINQGLDEEETNKRLDMLKESYAILSSEEERRLYDWSLARTETMDKYVWPFEVDITQIPNQLPPPQVYGENHLKVSEAPRWFPGVWEIKFGLSLQTKFYWNFYRSRKMLDQPGWWVSSSLRGSCYLPFSLWHSTGRKPNVIVSMPC